MVEGAAVGVPYFTADRALRHLGGAKSGEKVLIHGASGGVGLAAIQIAKFLGKIKKKPNFVIVGNKLTFRIDRRWYSELCCRIKNFK